MGREGRLLRRVPLDSSLLASALYDGRHHLLDLELRNGKVYRYFQVPARCYAALLKAESKGRYFNAEIRNCFPVQLLSPAAATHQI